MTSLWMVLTRHRLRTTRELVSAQAEQESRAPSVGGGATGQESRQKAAAMLRCRRVRRRQVPHHRLLGTSYNDTPNDLNVRFVVVNENQSNLIPTPFFPTRTRTAARRRQVQLHTYNNQPVRQPVKQAYEAPIEEITQCSLKLNVYQQRFLTAVLTDAPGREASALRAASVAVAACCVVEAMARTTATPKAIARPQQILKL